ncbi:hypothetical protein BV898_03474 [Hypsibius exemplaris]|uniref:G-protein coupled receptors family 1 profile domain-containing protein n=1 Tax=Hypsibius exemplaris TaxID=2072580 RepID=A0A1W0X550_HYPEX|nr:hypothetical protein BV898_03474 [Hypsibius exemplaris]
MKSTLNISSNSSSFVINNSTDTHGNQADKYSIHFRRLLAILPFIFIILCIATLLLNSLVLLAFIRNRNLRTPFNVYIISLVIADLLQACFDLPFTVYSELHPWTFSAAVRNGHSLISVNRVWALLLPISYRHHHTHTVAVGLCLGSWVYVHIFLLPGLVMDDVVYRVDDAGGCMVNTTAQRDWALPTQVVVYNSSVLIVGMSYPIIWWKVRQRRKVVDVAATKNAGEGAKTRTNTVGTVGAISVRRTVANGETSSVKRSAGGLHDDRDSDPVEMTTHNRAVVGQANAPRKRIRKSSQSFAVLTYLVLGVIFCWSPIMVYFTMAILNDYDSYWHLIIGTLLYYTNSVLDPVFFTMAMAPLRATLFRIFTR